MKYSHKQFCASVCKMVVISLVMIGIAAAVYGLSTDRSHEFSDDKCLLCHYDAKLRPDDIKENVTMGCNSCHSKLAQKKSHPSDVFPSMPIPKDMPLMNGQVTCITCHFVHPKEGVQLFSNKNNLLRRQTRGIFFCNICHQIDKDNHIIFENVHSGTYKVTNRTSRIDSMSLECIECHDTYIKTPGNLLGAGNWNHFNEKLSHPIGIDYNKIRSGNARNFKPESMFDNEIRLFDGKIGCGTCHNIYSSDKYMLVVENYRSRLCLQCHIK